MIDRFADRAVKTGCPQLSYLFDHDTGGQGNDGRRAVFRVVPQHLQNFKSIERRNVDVDQKNGWFEGQAFEARHKIHAVLEDGKCLDPYRSFKNNGHHFAAGKIILKIEDGNILRGLLAHGNLPTVGRAKWKAAPDPGSLSTHNLPP